MIVRASRLTRKICFSEEGAMKWTHIWFWRKRLPERKGQPCRVFVRSRRMNSIAVEFQDGFRVVTSRFAVRKAVR